MIRRRLKKRLGDILLEEGLLSDLQLAVALGEQKQWGGKLGAVLIKNGFIREPELASVLERQLGIQWVTLRGRPGNPAAMAFVKPEVARKLTVFPIDITGDTLTVAMSDPTDITTIDTLHFMTARKIVPLMALDSEILLAIARHYNNEYVSESAFAEAAGTAKSAGPKDHRGYDIGPSANKSTRGQQAEVEVLKQTIDVLIELLDNKGIMTRSEVTELLARKIDV